MSAQMNLSLAGDIKNNLTPRLVLPTFWAPAAKKVGTSLTVPICGKYALQFFFWTGSAPLLKFPSMSLPIR